MSAIRNTILLVFSVVVLFAWQEGLWANPGRQGCVPHNVGPGVCWVECTDEGTSCEFITDPVCQTICSSSCGMPNGWVGSCTNGEGFSCACAPPS